MGDRVILVGLSRPKIAEELMKAGANLTIVEKDETLCRKASKKFSIKVYRGREDDIHTLKRAGIEKAAMLVVATSNDDVNINVCRIAKKQFNVPDIVAVVNDPRRKDEYHQKIPRITVIWKF